MNADQSRLLEDILLGDTEFQDVDDDLEELDDEYLTEMYGYYDTQDYYDSLDKD